MAHFRELGCGRSDTRGPRSPGRPGIGSTRTGCRAPVAVCGVRAGTRKSRRGVQILLGFLRRDKAVTMPAGVDPDAPAFGSIPGSSFTPLPRATSARVSRPRLDCARPERLSGSVIRGRGLPLAATLRPAAGPSRRCQRQLDDLCEEHVLVRLNVGDFLPGRPRGARRVAPQPGRAVRLRPLAMRSQKPRAGRNLPATRLPGHPCAALG